MPKNSKPKLTDKQRKFIKCYITNGFNATQAAIDSGYSKNTAQRIGSENLSKPLIKEAILKHFERDGDIIQVALREIVKIATSDIQDFVTIDMDTGVTSIKPLKEIREGMTSVIKKIKHNRVIKEVPGKEKTDTIILDDRVEYELYDKQKSLDSILKIAGMLNEKVEHEFKEPIEVRVTREIVKEGKCD